MDNAAQAFRALAYALQNKPKSVQEVLQEMSLEDLDELSDGVERLAVLVDDMRIDRAERR